MKTKSAIFNYAISFLLIIGFINKGYSQGDESKFGDDPEKCKMNLSLYKEFVKQKNYKDAMIGWRVVIKVCPAATKSIYSDGVKIMKDFIKKADSDDTKEKYIDTLLMVYDLRIKHFGDDDKYPEGWILGRKAVDMLRYRPDNKDEAYEYLSKSLELMQNKTEAAVLVKLMLLCAERLKEGKITDEKMVETYAKAAEAVEFQIKEAQEAGKSIENLQKGQENIDNIFGGTTAATCEKIVPIFTPKFEANPEDIDVIKGIVKLLYIKECTDCDLYAKAAENLYKLEPSPLSAYALAKLFVKRGSFSKAVEYYKNAIELVEDDAEKAKYYYELGVIVSGKMNQQQQARSYAYKAIELNKGWGKPYILIGNAYASSSKECGDDEFAQKAVYWVAVDKFIQAKSVDASVAEEASQLINKFSAYFPNIENAFFHNVKEGDTYTVGCWINESTKARF